MGLLSLGHVHSAVHPFSASQRRLQRRCLPLTPQPLVPCGGAGAPPPVQILGAVPSCAVCGRPHPKRWHQHPASAATPPNHGVLQQPPHGVGSIDSCHVHSPAQGQCPKAICRALNVHLWRPESSPCALCGPSFLPNSGLWPQQRCAGVLHNVGGHDHRRPTKRCTHPPGVLETLVPAPGARSDVARQPTPDSPPLVTGPAQRLQQRMSPSVTGEP